MKTLIIGLGNPILGDDGVGWKVAEEVQRRLIADSRWQTAEASGLSAIGHQPSAIEVDCHFGGGLSLMERVVNYDRVLILDAICTRARPPGSLWQFGLGDLPTRHTVSAHDADLPTALRVAETLGAKIPREIRIIGVEAENVFEFSEHCSPPVAAAIPSASEAVRAQLQLWGYVIPSRSDQEAICHPPLAPESFWR